MLEVGSGLSRLPLNFQHGNLLCCLDRPDSARSGHPPSYRLFMSGFDYVLAVIDPWINKFIDCGANALRFEEIVGVGVWLLEAEVNNGGFDQYYFNSAGDLAVPTVDALRIIGASRTASLLAAANSEFPNLVPPANRDARQRALDEIRDSARFGALATEFYQGLEDLTALLALHFRNTPSA